MADILKKGINTFKESIGVPIYVIFNAFGLIILSGQGFATVCPENAREGDQQVFDGFVFRKLILLICNDHRLEPGLGLH